MPLATYVDFILCTQLRTCDLKDIKKRERRETINNTVFFSKTKKKLNQKEEKNIFL